MGRVLKKVILIILIALLGLGVTLIVLLTAGPREIKPYKSQYESLEEFKRDKFFKTLQTIDDNAENTLEASIDNNDANEILYHSLKQNNDKAGFTAFEAAIADGLINVYLQSKLLDILPVQYHLQLMPILREDRICFKLERVMIGKITIPKGLIFDHMAKMENHKITLDPKEHLIIPRKGMPPQLKLKKLTSEDGSLRMEVEANIKTLKDLKEVVKAALPTPIGYLVEVAPLEKLMDMDSNLPEFFSLRHVKIATNLILKFKR